MIIENGAYPSPLGYGGFPKSVCTSVNECICHGIPDSRPLEVCVCVFFITSPMAKNGVFSVSFSH